MMIDKNNALIINKGNNGKTIDESTEQRGYDP